MRLRKPAKVCAGLHCGHDLAYAYYSRPGGTGVRSRLMHKDLTLATKLGQDMKAPLTTGNYARGYSGWR